MRHRSNTNSLYALVSSGVLFFSVLFFAHIASNSAQPGRTNNASSEHFPNAKSPVESFRQLLAMERDEQEQMLANRTPEEKKEILAKVREYKALKPEQRELKLKATELRWYLQPLLSAPESQRARLLARVPQKDRKLVEDRLYCWDKLPVSARRELQSNEAALVYFSVPPEQRNSYVSNISPEHLEQVETGIHGLVTMPEGQRQKVLERFNHFFDFKEEEKQKILSSLSETERAQIEKTLKKFAELSPDQ